MSSGYSGIQYTNKFDFHRSIYARTAIENKKIGSELSYWANERVSEKKILADPPRVVFLLRNKISIKMLILQKHFTTFYCYFAAAAALR